MTQRFEKWAQSALSRRAFVGLGAAALAGSATRAPAQVRTPILDTHLHLARGLRRRDSLDRNVGAALRLMDAFGVERAIALPPPFPSGHRGLYGLDEIAAAVRRQPRLAFLAGGDSLNGLIHDTPAERVGSGDMRRFVAAADAIAAAGAAGFGEVTAEHFSSGRGAHPYESTAPDHPLFLALADLAARHGMPIDLHMEAVPADMPFPARRSREANPEMLRANIARFERLLAHNRNARIVWAHAGWDLTGERTVALMRGLLGRHPNLFMSVKQDRAGAGRTSPFGPSGELQPAWLAMLREFPDRFVIGSDQFADDDGAERMENARRLIDLLPPDLAGAVASGNARRIYRL